MFAKLALRSLLDRKGSVALSMMAMMISIFVLLGVEHIRHQAKDSFSNTVSGVDLIVGAKTGKLNLLLYSVFRIGSPTNNISWQSVERIAASPQVKWAIPMSLGDSHKGYRVLGTSKDYFQYFSYGQQHPLTFTKGHAFDGLFDVVLGSEVAKKLGYQLGDKVVLSHGIARTSFSLHDDYPFTVVGILAPTGTPVDQTLHVSLGGIEAIHVDWHNGVKIPHSDTGKGHFTDAQLQPKSVTALMLGLKSKISTFGVQRQINNDTYEPLLAILPGVALSELWQMMGVLENTLLLVSALVFVAACLGVSAMLLSSIRERSREIQLLRVVGAPPHFLFWLIELEALLITVVSMLLGAALLAACLALSQDYLVSQFGLQIGAAINLERSLAIMGIMLIASFVAALFPAIYASRKSLQAHG
ncbi:putative ABC transport system permease protein [Sinobacterium caligoides]|uniref:Putative ABC transport system permease protein n=1 Tax=Sinobacterium caligoides TaxID=933926 RepID=A0A3N2DFU8_9GAMM|nr:ABC transporter permease [Sinobacterium caligoides]ROR98685.1 putative ABC transport system permease protein [Sinobacterium caligoides]